MKNENHIEILIGGDFAPVNSAERIAIESPETIWGDMIDMFKNADFSIVNLEVPLTGSNTRIGKTGPNIKVPEACVNSIKAADIGLVTLANNHIYDFGDKGVSDTLEVCKKNGINTVGAGMNLELAQKIFYKEIKGLRIAVVNFAENEFNSAEIDHAGSNPMDLIDNVKQIRDAKKNSDFVMVIVHGGHEYYSYPSPRMQKQYRFYAEEGASVVIGHHTHCISGYEIHNKVPIFYSLGNLFFPWEGKPDFWYEGMLLKLTANVHDFNLRFEFIPFSQCKDGPFIKLHRGLESVNFEKELNEINRVIKEGELLEKEWKEFIRYHEAGTIATVTIPQRFLRKVLFKLGLLRFLRNRKHELMILNLTRCESHHDVLVKSLMKKK